MTSPNDTGWFTDVDQLDALTVDTRAADPLTVSDVPEAVDHLQAWRQHDAAGAWNGLARAEVADRLVDLVEQPRRITQGNLNLCGPAALVCMWAARDPLAFAGFATTLFDDGSADLGSLRVDPSADLVEADASKFLTGTHGADWMVLGAIRNSNNVFWQGTWRGDPDQELAGLTRPEELTAWLEATGIYAGVRNEANWVSPAGIPHATGLEMPEGRDVAVLLHTNLLLGAKRNRKTQLDHTFLLDQFPNHYVVALNTPTVAVADDVALGIAAGDVLLSVWSWGRNDLSLVVPADHFVANYYGAVIADLA